VIGLPPSNGATNDTVTCALPPDTVGCAGASGTRFGTTTADAGDGALVPFAFVAVTVHVYDFPFERPARTIGEPAPDARPDAPPLDDTHVASYCVIALPPLNGAANITVTCPLPAPTVGCAGADGTVLGITGTDAGDGALGPFAFVAVTVHEYDFPFVNDATTMGEPAPDADPAAPPFDDTHTAPKLVIALPPSAGATNDTETCAFPNPTVGCAGADGTVLGITGADAGDGALVPFAFVAVTVHVYDFPFERPARTIGDPAPAASPVTPPFDDTHVAPKFVIALPPSSGTTNDTVTCVSAPDTEGWAGAFGTVLGITGADAGEGAPSPSALVAVTVHVYSFPFDSEPTTIGEPTSEAEPAPPPFDDTQAAVYSLIGLPPSNGATNDTVSCAFPEPTVGCVGASGTRFGTTADDAGDGGLVPFALVAVTVHVYDFPFDNGSTTIGEPAPELEPAAPPFDETHIAS